MSDAAPPTLNAPLGVGNIVSESFSILGKHFVSTLALVIIPTLLGLVVSVALIGFGATTGQGGFEIGFNFSWTPIIVGLLIQFIIGGLTTALLIQLAYDVKLQRQTNLVSYIGPALVAAIPITLLSVAIAVMAFAGFIVVAYLGLPDAVSIIAFLGLAVLAIWVYSVYYVMAPVVVIEKNIFGALGRSSTLTQGVRWPIIGLMIIMAIIGFVYQLITTFVLELFADALGTGGVGLTIYLVLFSLLSSVIYGLTGIVVSLVYARLREIKEGVSVDQIASVFD